MRRKNKKVPGQDVPIPEKVFERALKRRYSDNVVLQDMARTLFYRTRQQYVWGVKEMDDETFDGVIGFVNDHLDRVLKRRKRSNKRKARK